MAQARDNRFQSIRSLIEIARRGERTIIMGVLNVTPDSFSDGGLFFDPDAALRHAEQMAADGADILDVGGESTRPGSEPLSAKAEIDRVLPVVDRITSKITIPISIDTYKAAVARAAIEAGASMVNDISALTFDSAMAGTVAELQVPICLMHIKGVPKSMQQNPEYEDIVREIKDWLADRASAAIAAGTCREDIVVDPGFGFGKTVEQNLELMRRLREFTVLGYPVMIGTSRKSTLGRVMGGLPVEDRLEATVATVALSIANGASIVRVHDVKQMARVARMTDAIVRGWMQE